MFEQVMACDPGGRSGWAEAVMTYDRFEYRDGGVLPMKDMGIWAAEQQCVAQGRYEGDRSMFGPRWDVIVVESWRPRRKNGSLDWIEGSPLIYAQHVGQIRLVGMLSGAQVVVQEPKDKYNPATKDVPPPSYPQALQEIDDLSSEQHDRDARYHLWVYFWRNWFTGSVRPNDTMVVS